MKLKTTLTLFAAAATFLFTSASFAGITDVIFADDGDGAFQCGTNIYSFPTPTPEASVTIEGNQYWGPGHVLVDVLTDTELDPTLTLANLIDNDTSYAWAGYQVDIFMNKAFSILSPSISLPVGWSVQSYTPAAVGSGTSWAGQIVYGGATPVNPGQNIYFTYTLQFEGTVGFLQEMLPIAVPEPTALSLLLGGGLVLGLIRRQRK